MSNPSDASTGAKAPVFTLSKNLAGLVLVLVTTVLAGWRPLVDTLALSLHRDEYTYILLILPVSFALLFQQRRRLQALTRANVRVGLVFLVIVLVIAVLALAWSARLPRDILLAIGMFALVISWIAAFVLCLGAAASRVAMFPLLLLFGMVPPPEIVLNPVVAVMQQGSAWAAHLLFAAFGVPVAQDGTLLAIPGLVLMVAPECSSIRSSSMLLVVTLVAAQLLLRSFWRKLCVIAVAVPLSIAKNGLRVFTIAMLGTRVDRGYLTGSLHHHGGIVFFLVALVAIFAVVLTFREREVRSDRPVSGMPSAEDLLPSSLQSR